MEVCNPRKFDDESPFQIALYFRVVSFALRAKMK